jgi:hypothetical protein
LIEINEICISGIATTRQNSLPTQQNEERKREHEFRRESVSN